MDNVVSFKTLRELRAKEQGEGGLSKLPENFYPLCSEYIKGVSRKADDKASLLEAENAKKTLEDIFEMRERKMLLMALHASRGSIAPVNLLPEEREFFDKAMENIVSLRKSLLKDVVEGRLEMKAEQCVPVVDPPHKTAMPAAPFSSPPSQSRPAPLVQRPPPPAVQPKTAAPMTAREPQTITPAAGEGKNSMLQVTTDNGRMRVRMLQPLPEFMGTDERPYGPLEKGDEIELPEDVARFLIGKKAAEAP